MTHQNILHRFTSWRSGGEK